MDITTNTELQLNNTTSTYIVHPARHVTIKYLKDINIPTLNHAQDIFRIIKYLPGNTIYHSHTALYHQLQIDYTKCCKYGKEHYKKTVIEFAFQLGIKKTPAFVGGQNLKHSGCHDKDSHNTEKYGR